MIFRIGIENNNEGFRSIAWALEHPGLTAYGSTPDEALDNLFPAIHNYTQWIERHTPAWLDPHDPELIVEETFDDYDINADLDIVEKGEYTVEPFFQYDWKPLTANEMETSLELLAWSRTDLLTLLDTLTPQQWDLKAEGERWDVAGIVRHIGGAEWWYLDRLGLAFPRPEVSPEPRLRLDQTRAALLAALPPLVDVTRVSGQVGELWSPRKIIRRTAWHERDHTEHIRKVLGLVI